MTGKVTLRDLLANAGAPTGMIKEVIDGKSAEAKEMRNIMMRMIEAELRHAKKHGKY